MTGTITNAINANSTTPLPLGGGGTNDSLTANVGGIVWSDASKLNILAGTSTANQTLLSGASATPAWSTATYPATTTGNQLLYSSGTNTIAGLTTPSSGILTANGSGILTWLTILPLSLGGTNNSLTGSSGGIVWSDASKLNILAGTSTANQLLLSGASATPAWSTSTYPAVNAINTLLYASAANTMAALATGNNGCLVTSAGGVPSISSTLPAAVINNIPGRLASFQVLTSGTGATYNATANTTSILVECIGGGGGGGGSLGAVSSYAAAGGGGAGGYARLFIASSASTYTYTVGAAGAAGTAGNNAGGTGGTTSFGASLQATGGSGGSGSGGVAATGSLMAIGGAAGVGSNGDTNTQGGAGTYGISVLGNTASGNGGNSLLGSGAVGIVAAATGNSATTNTGGGGGGAVSTTSSNAGGAGGSGIIIVWEFA